MDMRRSRTGNPLLVFGMILRGAFQILGSIEAVSEIGVDSA